MQNQSSQKIPLLYRPYNLPEFFPVVAFLGSNWKVTMQTPEFTHFHNCIEIGHCISGSGTFYINGQYYTYGAGDFSIVYSDISHITLTNKENTHWEYIYIDTDLFLHSLHHHAPFLSSDEISLFASLKVTQKSPFIIKKTDGDHVLFQLLSELYLEYHCKNSLYQNMILGLISSLLSQLISIEKNSSDPEEHPKQLEIIRDSLACIHGNYASELSIKELAAKNFISESHFRRIFKKTVGLSPQEYLEHYRIHQACHLIYTKAAPLNEIARMVGFQTLSCFNRQFQKCMHTSPSKWYRLNMTFIPSHEIHSLSDSSSRSILDL